MAEKWEISIFYLFPAGWVSLGRRLVERDEYPLDLVKKLTEEVRANPPRIGKFSADPAKIGVSARRVVPLVSAGGATYWGPPLEGALE